MELTKFTELEEKVKNILQDYALLKRQNRELEERLKNKDIELEGARARLDELSAERDAIRTKVDSLLDLLQNVNI